MRASVALRLANDPASLAGTVARWVARRRWWIVGACVAAQWAFVAFEALRSITHNGWIYEHGDDGTWYWTSAWTLSSLHIPVTNVGIGWPYVLSPLAALLGPDMANGLPGVVALNVVVLAPLAVVGMYLLGERVAGRVFGVWAAVLWTLLPLVALGLYHHPERATVVRFFLPTADGLNALADYPSTVLAIFAAYLTLRSVDSGEPRDGIACGLAIGFLVLLKPANAPLALAAGATLLLARRSRVLAAASIAILPAVVTLTVWKQRGMGYLPAFAFDGHREAVGPSAPVVADARHYINLDWHQVAVNAHALSEVFWSLRALEFLLVAGSFGLLVRARLRGFFVVAWFLGYALIKGTVSYASVYDTSLYRFLLPAWPAWVVIVGGVVFCWPFGRARRATMAAEQRPSSRTIPRSSLVVAAIVFAAGPLGVAIAGTPVGKDMVAQAYRNGDYTGSPVPVVSFGLRAQRLDRGTVQLSWRSMATSHAVTSYQVYKGRDDGCRYQFRGAPDCYLAMQVIGGTRSMTFVDRQATGTPYYRVALGPGPTIQPDTPSLLLMSTPAVAR